MIDFTHKLEITYSYAGCLHEAINWPFNMQLLIGLEY